MWVGIISPGYNGNKAYIVILTYTSKFDVNRLPLIKALLFTINITLSCQIGINGENKFSTSSIIEKIFMII